MIKDERRKTGIGFADAQKCPKCKLYYEGYNGYYNVDGEIMCEYCFIEWIIINTRSYFVSHTPAFCDGATHNVFTFNTKEEFYEKIKSKISKNEILVKSKDRDNCILVQNITKSYWWVLGAINNCVEEINIPTANFSIYDENKIAIQSKVDEMTKGKDIIRSEES